jgi:hypothetical protein
MMAELEQRIETATAALLREAEALNETTSLVATRAREVGPLRPDDGDRCRKESPIERMQNPWYPSLRKKEKPRPWLS